MGLEFRFQWRSQKSEPKIGIPNLALPPAPVLNMLPSDRTIVLAVNHDTALIMLQGVMSTRAHIPATGSGLILSACSLSQTLLLTALSTGSSSAGPIASPTRKGGQRIQCEAIGWHATQQDKGDKGHETRRSGNGGGVWG